MDKAATKKETPEVKNLAVEKRASAKKDAKIAKLTKHVEDMGAISVGCVFRSYRNCIKPSTMHSSQNRD